MGGSIYAAVLLYWCGMTRRTHLVGSLAAGWSDDAARQWDYCSKLRRQWELVPRDGWLPKQANLGRGTFLVLDVSSQFSLGGVGLAWRWAAELRFLKVNFLVKLWSGNAIYRPEMIYTWERWTLTRTHDEFKDKHQSYGIWLRFLPWLELGKEDSCLLWSRHLDEGEGAPVGWAKPRGMGLSQMEIRKGKMVRLLQRIGPRWCWKF
jgi:hypothetical protein